MTSFFLLVVTPGAAEAQSRSSTLHFDGVESVPNEAARLDSWSGARYTPSMHSNKHINLNFSDTSMSRIESLSQVGQSS